MANSLFLFKRLFRLTSFIFVFPGVIGSCGFYNGVSFTRTNCLKVDVHFVGIYSVISFLCLSETIMCVLCGFHSDCVCFLRICIPSPNRLRIPA